MAMRWKLGMVDEAVVYECLHECTLIDTCSAIAPQGSVEEDVQNQSVRMIMNAVGERRIRLEAFQDFHKPINLSSVGGSRSVEIHIDDYREFSHSLQVFKRLGVIGAVCCEPITMVDKPT